MTESAGGQAFQQTVTGDMVGKELEELAREGWTVFRNIGRHQLDWLPEPLQDFELDYVARKDDEIIIGEVKSRSPQSLQTLDQTLNRLARAVAKVPNARLELHWLGDIAATASVAPLDVDSADVQSQIDETRILLRLHHVRPAALIAWSAVEGALIYHAARLDTPLPDDARTTRSPWQLLSYLDSLGYINEADLKRLTELRNQRNAVAHFSGQGAIASDEDIEYGLNFAERILSGRYVSADQMVDWYQSQPKVSITRLSEAREIARSLLGQNFPGVEARDVDEAVERLYPEE